MNVRRYTPDEHRARLDRLRQVAPGALRDLAEPALNDPRTELLALPTSVDPQEWLRENRADAISRNALRTAVTSLTDQVRGRLAARSFDPDKAAKFAPWRDLVAVDPRETTDQLDDRLRSFQADPPPLDIDGGLSPVFSLTALLLRTPPEVSPLDWVRENGRDDAAMAMLAKIVNLSRVPPDWSEAPELIDEVRHVSGESSVTVGSARLSLRIERLYLTTRGFRLPVSLRYDDGKREPDRTLHLDFREIDTARDSLGNHYLPATRSGEMSLKRGVIRWELSFYPAPVREARGLTIGFSNAIVGIESRSDAIARMGQQGRPTPFDGPTIEFGELLATIPLTPPTS